MSKNLSISSAEDLVRSCFFKHGVPEGISKILAVQLVASEVDGQVGHGLMRVGSYIGQIKAGKIVPDATAKIEVITRVVASASAEHGFSYPAVNLAIDFLSTSAFEFGIALAGVVHGHHFGQIGLHVEKLANKGLIGICMGNTPKAMAIYGGSKPFFGTNPLAFSCPIKGKDPLVIDLALSVVARGKIVRAKQEGKSIKPEWAVDSEGNPTSDPSEALKGSLQAIGGAKGSALAMMVEILSACLTNSSLSTRASSLLEPGGGYPDIGYMLLALNPKLFSADGFAIKMHEMIEDMKVIAPDARLPGVRRLKLREQAKVDGLMVSDDLYKELMELSA